MCVLLCLCLCTCTRFVLIDVYLHWCVLSCDNERAGVCMCESVCLSAAWGWRVVALVV